MSETSTTFLEKDIAVETPPELARKIITTLDRVMTYGTSTTPDERNHLPRHLGYFHHEDRTHQEVYGIVNAALDWAVADPNSDYKQLQSTEVEDQARVEIVHTSGNRLVVVQHGESDQPYASTYWILAPNQDPLY